MKPAPVLQIANSSSDITTFLDICVRQSSPKKITFRWLCSTTLHKEDCTLAQFLLALFHNIAHRGEHLSSVSAGSVPQHCTQGKAPSLSFYWLCSTTLTTEECTLAQLLLLFHHIARHRGGPYLSSVSAGSVPPHCTQRSVP